MSRNQKRLSYSYTMVCQPVQDLTSELSYIQMDNNGITIYTASTSIDLARYEIDHAKVGKGGIMLVSSKTTNGMRMYNLFHLNQFITFPCVNVTCDISHKYFICAS